MNIVKKKDSYLVEAAGFKSEAETIETALGLMVGQLEEQALLKVKYYNLYQEVKKKVVE